VQFPRVAKKAPASLKNAKSGWSFREEAIDHEQEALLLEIWLHTLTSDPVLGTHNTVVKFLQPVDKVAEAKKLKRNSRGIWEVANINLERSMQSALSNVGSALQQLSSPSQEGLRESRREKIMEKPEPIPEELPTSSVISRQDLEIILDIVFSAVEELFSSPDQWLRQQSLNLIKVLLRSLFGKRVSSSITSKLEKASNQKNISKQIGVLTERLWPGGEKFGSEERIEPSAHEIDRVKHQLFCLLNGQNDVAPSEDFKKTVKGIKNLVGMSNTRQGLLRGFHLIQDQDLNRGLCVEIIEVLITIITNPA
jgi:hypothetical protein